LFPSPAASGVLILPGDDLLTGANAPQAGKAICRHAGILYFYTGLVKERLQFEKTTHFLCAFYR